MQPCRILECTAKLLVQHVENCVLNTAIDWHHWLDWRFYQGVQQASDAMEHFDCLPNWWRTITLSSHRWNFHFWRLSRGEFPYWPAFVSFLDRLNETQDCVQLFSFSPQNVTYYFISDSLFLTQRGAVTMTILTVPWYRTHSTGAKKKIAVRDGCRPTISVVVTWHSLGSSSQQTSQESSETACTVDGADCNSDGGVTGKLQFITGAHSWDEGTGKLLRSKRLMGLRKKSGSSGREGLTRFLLLPPTWLRARMLLSTKFVVKQAETLLQNYCFETICKSPEQQNQYLFQKWDLGQLMALRLAEIVTELMQSVLQHPVKGLMDESNAPLLTQLHSSRFRARWDKEEKRPPHGLVKILCLCFETLLGAASGSIPCWCGFQLQNIWWDSVGGQQDTVAFLPRGSLTGAGWGWSESYFGCSSQRGLATLNTRTFYHVFPRLYRHPSWCLHTESLHGFALSSARVVVSLLLPGSLEVQNWLLTGQTEKEHVATADGHAYSWLHLGHRTFHAERTTTAEGQASVGWTWPAMGQAARAALHAKSYQSEQESSLWAPVP